MSRLSLIAFDADDTLWHHERYFELTTARFEQLLRPYADPHHLREHLTAAERRNLKHYGFGVKGFTLSMIETAVEITEGRVPGKLIGELIDAGREMLRHPIEALPHVETTLAALAASHRLIVVTKGDLFDQERKIAASELGEHFAAIEIVSDKTADTYTRLFARHGDGAARAMMVGNSLSSDVVPALEAGAWGIHVPSPHNWVLDHHPAEVTAPRFRRIDDIGGLLPIVREIDLLTDLTPRREPTRCDGCHCRRP